MFWKRKREPEPQPKPRWRIVVVTVKDKHGSYLTENKEELQTNLDNLAKNFHKTRIVKLDDSYIPVDKIVSVYIEQYHRPYVRDLW